jgi:hypothetical protein
MPRATGPEMCLRRAFIKAIVLPAGGGIDDRAAVRQARMRL